MWKDRTDFEILCIYKKPIYIDWVRMSQYMPNFFSAPFWAYCIKINRSRLLVTMLWSIESSELFFYATIQVAYWKIDFRKTDVTVSRFFPH